MLSAIELDREMLFGAEEIQDERAARMLPSELETFKLARAEVLPERRFSVRSAATQRAPALER